MGTTTWEFVCKSLETAISSVATWYGVADDEIVSLLSSDIVTIYESSQEQYEMDFKSFLGQWLPLRVSDNQQLPRVHWFHGTRCFNDHDFDKGIKPLLTIFPLIRERIDLIAAEHKIPKGCAEDNDDHSALLIHYKMQQTYDQGPCAVLNIEALLKPSAFYFHSYLGMPEIVEDYIRCTYGKRSEELLDLLKRFSKPTIVEFWSIPDEENNPDISQILQATLMYIYAMLHRDTEMLSDMCNTCYSGNGTAISPERIISIEIMREAW